MTKSMPTGGTADVGSTMAVVPLGTKVWLPREGRSGRVVARAQGGLLYRVRPKDGTECLLERPACELELRQDLTH